MLERTNLDWAWRNAKSARATPREMLLLLLGQTYSAEPAWSKCETTGPSTDGIVARKKSDTIEIGICCN
jgi:hypothetical protein